MSNNKAGVVSLVGVLLVFVGLVAYAGPPKCENLPGGGTITYWCDNSCVVTRDPDGSIGVEDCCGGQVHFEIDWAADAFCGSN